MSAQWKKLDVAVMGGGIGGLSAAVAMRRAGHKVTVYERRNFAAEVGASISCAANGTQWLHEWKVDVPSGRPVVLLHLTMRDWKTSEPIAVYDLSDYEKKWGNVYNMFHRQDMHTMLLETATAEDGEGDPVKVVVDYICDDVDVETSTIKFRNGKEIKADVIIGADGIRSNVRTALGIKTERKYAPQTCFRCNVLTDDVKRLGLVDYSYEPAIQYWNGFEQHEDVNKYFKIVMSPCAGGDIVSFYCFMPTEYAAQHTSEGFTFKEVDVEEMLVGAYADKLEKNVVDLLKASIDRMPWRLYVHDEYPYWSKGPATLLGDAAHPMMPHQSQGACQAIEDAAALGIIFSKNYPQYTHDVAAGLRMYEKIRKPRASRVQMASRLATDDINERIGFTSLNLPSSFDATAKELGWTKLTIPEMNTYDMKEHIAKEAASEVAA
ncbi:hypothetical protein BD626DRAFT_567760 [Schizophyllum amplum]|uniref:FAD-binding domain-containing protein n=1 Tax=Schizophyllum amplum TaxID=97359 RepID=A0A550CJA1_9AGAR|nr:hypothetical protein BD626DRAFT_567760 [Auriculariopsis ampla]